MDEDTDKRIQTKNPAPEISPFKSVKKTNPKQVLHIADNSNDI